jgi:class 3 adenylate cyclase
VPCAVDIQQDIAAREADLPDEQRIRVRIGVNLGDVIVEGSDIYGDGVNIATRLEAIGAPGHVVISDDARRQVGGRRRKANRRVGWLLLGEALSPLQAPGGAAVLAGIFIASSTYFQNRVIRDRFFV